MAVPSLGKKHGFDHIRLYPFCTDSTWIPTVNHVGIYKKTLFLILVGASLLTSADAVLAACTTYEQYYNCTFQGEAQQRCAADEAAGAASGNSYNAECRDIGGAYTCKFYNPTNGTDSGVPCNGWPYIYTFQQACPTSEESQFTSSPPPSSICVEGCRYISGGTGVGVCAGNTCLSPYTGSGDGCNGTEGGGTPDGCSVDPSGAIVCDCLEMPALCDNPPDPNCEEVDGFYTCYDEDDPNNPINNPNPPDDPNLPPSEPNPNETPDLPDTPLSPATPSPDAPTPTTPAPNVPDGDSSSPDKESEADNTQGIINAINVNTSAVDNVATTVFNAGEQVTQAVDTARMDIVEAIDNDRKQTTDAIDNNALTTKENLTTETDRLIQQANSDRTLNFTKDFDNTKKITDALKDNCNPMSNPDCASAGSAVDSDHCGAPPVCTSPDETACAQLMQSWNIMCAIMDGDEETPSTDSGTASGDCSAPPVCVSENPVDCLAMQQTWESTCAALDTQGEVAPWEAGGDPDYNRDLADESTAIDVQGGQDQSGFASGACPANLAVATSFVNFSIDTSYLCTYAGVVRIFVILITLLWSGVYIVRSF